MEEDRKKIKVRSIYASDEAFYLLRIYAVKNGITMGQALERLLKDEMKDK